MNSLTRDQLGLMFHKVVDTCEKKLYDPKLNGVNWRQLAEARKERILAAGSDEELERELTLNFESGDPKRLDYYERLLRQRAERRARRGD